MQISASESFTASDSSQILKSANPSTIHDKFLVGYQGWFTCAGDGEPVDPGHHGWLHWFDCPIPDGGRPNTDVWPDVSGYPSSELFPAPGLKTKSGDQTYLFSSRNPKTVERQFHWMAKHGVDGAFLQRFAGQCDMESGNKGIRRIRDEVGQHVREAAEREGRVFAIMYDVSGVPPDRIQRVLERDWIHLVHNQGVLDSPNYLKEREKPVVALWGFGFDNRGHTPALVRAITQFFRNATPGGVYIMAGAPTHWRTAEGDADRNSEFLDVWLNEFDAISPWTVGRYRTEDDAVNFAETKMKADLALIKKQNDEEATRKIDYIPVVFPGFSGYNLSQGKWGFNDYKREGGKFLWKQIYNARRLGVRTMYGAMWDEYDEGTAFMPIVEHKRNLPVSDKYSFLALDADGYDLPSDWYMRICGFAAEGLRNDRRILETFPVKELQDYWSSRPRYEDVNPNSKKLLAGPSLLPGSSLSHSSSAKTDTGGVDLGDPGDGQTYQEWLALEKEKEEKNEAPPPPYTLEVDESTDPIPSQTVTNAETSRVAAAAAIATTPEVPSVRVQNAPVVAANVQPIASPSHAIAALISNGTFVALASQGEVHPRLGAQSSQPIYRPSPQSHSPGGEHHLQPGRSSQPCPSPGGPPPAGIHPQPGGSSRPYPSPPPAGVQPPQPGRSSQPYPSPGGPLPAGVQPPQPGRSSQPYPSPGGPPPGGVHPPLPGRSSHPYPSPGGPPPGGVHPPPPGRSSPYPSPGGPPPAGVHPPQSGHSSQPYPSPSGPPPGGVHPPQSGHSSQPYPSPSGPPPGGVHPQLGHSPQSYIPPSGPPPGGVYHPQQGYSPQLYLPPVGPPLGGVHYPQQSYLPPSGPPPGASPQSHFSPSQYTTAQGQLQVGQAYFPPSGPPSDLLGPFPQGQSPHAQQSPVWGQYPQAYPPAGSPSYQGYPTSPSADAPSQGYISPNAQSYLTGGSPAVRQGYPPVDGSSQSYMSNYNTHNTSHHQSQDPVATLASDFGRQSISGPSGGSGVPAGGRLRSPPPQHPSHGYPSAGSSLASDLGRQSISGPSGGSGVSVGGRLPTPPPLHPTLSVHHTSRPTRPLSAQGGASGPSGGSGVLVGGRLPTPPPLHPTLSVHHTSRPTRPLSAQGGASGPSGGSGVLVGGRLPTPPPAHPDNSGYRTSHPARPSSTVQGFRSQSRPQSQSGNRPAAGSPSSPNAASPAQEASTPVAPTQTRPRWPPAEWDLDTPPVTLLSGRKPSSASGLGGGANLARPNTFSASSTGGGSAPARPNPTSNTNVPITESTYSNAANTHDHSTTSSYGAPMHGQHGAPTGFPTGPQYNPSHMQPSYAGQQGASTYSSAAQGSPYASAPVPVSWPGSGQVSPPPQSPSVAFPGGQMAYGGPGSTYGSGVGSQYPGGPPFPSGPPGGDVQFPQVDGGYFGGNQGYGSGSSSGFPSSGPSYPSPSSPPWMSTGPHMPSR